jgi:hypothetical protein
MKFCHRNDKLIAYTWLSSSFTHFLGNQIIMAKDFSLMEDSNRSSNPSIHDVSDPSRR